MMDSTIETPERVPVPAPTPKLLKRAVFYGMSFDLITSLAFGYICGLIYPIVVTRGVTFAYTNLSQEMTTLTLFLTFFYVFGTGISIMAGYLTAYIAKVRPYTHVIWAASIFFLIHAIASVPSIINMSGGTTMFSAIDAFNIFALPVVFPSYLLGAYIYQTVGKSYENTLA